MDYDCRQIARVTPPFISSITINLRVGNQINIHGYLTALGGAQTIFFENKI